MDGTDQLGIKDGGGDQPQMIAKSSVSHAESMAVEELHLSNSDVSNKIGITVGNNVGVMEGPTNKGVRCHSFLTPSGNRIQNLELLQDWIGSNLVCGFCKQGSPTMVKEIDMEGLSSKILWQC